MDDAKPDFNVYKQLSAEMRDGLKNIYHQASSASAHSTDALFTEASDQLEEVIKTTESAAMTIMEIVEKQQELTQESAAIIERIRQKLADDPDPLRLSGINESLANDLTTLLTSLSFQDIAGQRIKKAMAALGAIENSVLELYLSSGLIMDAAENPSGKDAEELRAEARKAVENIKENRSQLKGPDKNAPSQAAIDDMLSQLGL